MAFIPAVFIMLWRSLDPKFVAQKLNVACRSILRTAAPVENGPP
jgi:hypothetical protein